MTPHPQMKGKYKTFFCQLSSFVWVEEPCAVSPQNSVRKNQKGLAFLALAIWSLRKDTASACGSLQILLCASCTEEQDPSMILCCLTSHSAVRLYTLYAHGLKNSNIHSPEKLLVPSNEKHLFFPWLPRSIFSIFIYLLKWESVMWTSFYAVWNSSLQQNQFWSLLDWTCMSIIITQWF